jgi:hypothetical protein
MFLVKQEEAYSTIKEIKARVPQGSVLGPIPLLMYTWDIPQEEDITTATYADDTAILAVGYSSKETTTKLQEACFRINDWTRLWRMRINENKSVHIDFAYKKNVQIPVPINKTNIPCSNSANYLGMNLDIQLRWKEHVKKRRELDIKYKKKYWLLGRKSQLSVHAKLLLYKQVLKPIWTYGIQLWGCAPTSNLKYRYSKTRYCKVLWTSHGIITTIIFTEI